MKKFYMVLLSLVTFFTITNKGFSQTANVSYQFYLDVNNNCNYDAGENLLYNIGGAITFTYVNASSATITVLDSVYCGGFVSINNPQLPPSNGFTVAPTFSTSLNTFSVNFSCSAYSNLSYTTTNYLPIQSIGSINSLYAYTSITGWYMASASASIFPVCNNITNDSLSFYINISDVYTCGGFNASRTYSLVLDATTIDVITVNGGIGINSASSSSCVVTEYYYTPMTTLWIKTKVGTPTLAPGNHSFEIKSTPIYTSTLSTFNYSCTINAVPCSSVTGSVYEDCDNNCVKNAGDGSLYFYGAVVKLYDAATSYSLYPDASGNFSAFLPPSTSQYSITSIPTTSFYTPCPAATATTAVVASTGYDFGYKNPTLYQDPNIFGPSVPGTTNPGSIKTVNIYVFNFPLVTACALSFPVNPGKVKAVLDKNFTYLNVVGSTPVPNAIVPGPSGDTLIWNVANLNFTNTINYQVSAQMASTVTIGTGYTNYSMVYPTNDANLSNNFSVCTWSVGLPFDPNNKISWASGVQPNGDIPLSTTDLFYTINFQNIGTAPAVNVKSADTLDANLDWSTLQLVSSSFPVQIQMDNVTGTTFFNFNGINLPDSTSNEPASHGYVQYRIKLKPSVPVNTVIKNRAHNYFDFQPAVATNQTKNKLVTATAINEIERAVSVFIAPNPVTDKVTISAKGIIQTVLVYNNLGQIVMKQDVNNTQSQMDLGSMNEGVYFINVQFKDGDKTIRKVVKN